MTEHTKGPWRRGKISQVIVSGCKNGLNIPGADNWGYYGGYLIAESVSKVNAPLIAAAPELLEALENITGEAAFTGLPEEKQQDIYTAIAKAKGNER